MPTLTAQLVGGPTAILEYAGLRWLTDPSLSPPGEYEGGLVKTAGPALDVNAIEPIDVVLLSHDHHAAEATWRGSNASESTVARRASGGCRASLRELARR